MRAYSTAARAALAAAGDGGAALGASGVGVDERLHLGYAVRVSLVVERQVNMVKRLMSSSLVKVEREGEKRSCKFSSKGSQGKNNPGSLTLAQKIINHYYLPQYCYLLRGTYAPKAGCAGPSHAQAHPVQEAEQNPPHITRLAA